MLRVDDQEFERVREFRYLGSTVTEEIDITFETKEKILMTNQANDVMKK
jgi:hypothetical protein